MEEVKYYYVRCEWCKNIEPWKFGTLDITDFGEPGKFYFVNCDICKKKTLQMIVGYDE